LSGGEQLSYKSTRVQRLRRLLARRDFREAEGRFVAEGPKLLGEVLAAGLGIETVFVAPGWRLAASGRHIGELLERSRARGAEVAELAPGVLERVAGTTTPQPVLAVVERPQRSLAELRRQPLQLVVVCVGVQDPGNVGALVRSAWAAGAGALIACEGTADPWGPKAVRASAGGALHLCVIEAPSATEALGELGGLGLKRLAAVAAGGEDCATVDLARPVALVFGNESAGLHLASLAGQIDGAVSVPMPGGAESLNVAAAAAVICFEAARQRRAKMGLQGAAIAGKLATL